MTRHVSPDSPRRSFLQRLAGATGISALAARSSAAQTSTAQTAAPAGELPGYARTMHHGSLKQSSYDRTGGNADRWQIAAGGTQEVFQAEGPGAITHIWFTLGARSSNHLKEIVLRAWWDGNAKPSIEVPLGDFFGLNLGQYFVYQSAFLNCSSVKALNCYFRMPYRRSARLAVTNEGRLPVDAFYSNIDYQTFGALPEDAMYFHAQYRQKMPNAAVHLPDGKNLEGRDNYVYVETRGRGHLMGVTLGVIQNAEFWMGEGDDMIFIDDERRPVITGTGSEDYFNGAWDFGGRDGAQPFAHLYNGAPFIANAEHTGGRYCLYRWHADNPVTFTRYLRHTMEHGHANDRADNFYSVAYWYQSAPSTDFQVLPAVEERVPGVKG
jgi:hypothetical protein